MFFYPGLVPRAFVNFGIGNSLESLKKEIDGRTGPSVVGDLRKSIFFKTSILYEKVVLAFIVSAEGISGRSIVVMDQISSCTGCFIPRPS